MHIYFLFSENYPAQKDLWLYHTFPAIKSEAKLMGRTPPYALAQYNIMPMMSNLITSNVCSVTARILNHINAAITTKQRLPRFIAIFPDKDIVEHTNFFGWGVTCALEAQVQWLVNEVKRIISTRIEELTYSRPCGVIPGEPKIIYIKMLDRPEASRAMSVKWKFTKALEETVAKKKHGYLMNIKVNQSWFDKANNLTTDGRIQFWREFDYQLEKFDKKIITLHPPRPDVRHKQDKPSMANLTARIQQKDGNKSRCKQPTPPY